jgi:uncharacterized membrane protein YgdD (TMEM256/DUF423 family)
MEREPSRLEPLARRCLAAGALLMLVGVILGAFGAHVLQERLTPQRLASFQTGVHYHMLHALGLLLLGVLVQVGGASARLRWSARLMLVGIALFSGSIYLMTAGAPRTLGMVAPLGGVSFMAAWALLAWHALTRPSGSLTRPSGSLSRIAGEGRGEGS